MAYENMTYEVILQRMMDRVSSEYSNLDMREGSIIFNALAPAAAELAIMYIELENARNESFVNTATREYILIACEQMGMDISVFNASAGIHKATFNVEVPINSRWNCDLYNYTVQEYLGLEGEYHTYSMLCETTGTEPNNQTGDLTPITEVPNDLTYAKLVECLIEGENETSDDNVRKAYYEYVTSAVSDGNVAQYKRWCNEYKDEHGVRGIGNAKVFSLWNGANTVKVSILSASNRKASDTLISEFQEYLDPGIKGMGDGVAPIGAFVTVTTAEEVPINVSATISLKDGYTDTTTIGKVLEDYFAQISYEKNVVAYMNVGAVILNADCVEFITDLRINDGTTDIVLGAEQIPILGSATWTVSE